MKHILITGMNSYIGTSFEVYMHKYDDAYAIDTIDTYGSAWKRADFSRYDAVFHVAGIAHVNAKRSMKDIYYQVNRDLAVEVAKKAKLSGVRQFVFMSSIIVYGESKSLKPIVITKSTIPKPNGFYGDSKLQAERALLPLQDDAFGIVILRPPMIYGVGSKGNFPKLVRLVKLLPIFPDYPNQRSILYIENLCEFVRQLIDHGGRGIFFPQNEEYASTTRLVKCIAEQLGKKIKITKALGFLVVLGSHVFNPVNKLFGSLVYDNAVSKLPFEFHQHSLEDSIRQSIR